MLVSPADRQKCEGLIAFNSRENPTGQNQRDTGKSKVTLNTKGKKTKKKDGHTQNQRIIGHPPLQYNANPFSGNVS